MGASPRVRAKIENSSDTEPPSSPGKAQEPMPVAESGEVPPQGVQSSLAAAGTRPVSNAQGQGHGGTDADTGGGQQPLSSQAAKYEATSDEELPTYWEKHWD